MIGEVVVEVGEHYDGMASFDDGCDEVPGPASAEVDLVSRTPRPRNGRPRLGRSLL